MNKYLLPNSEIEVSKIAYGCMGIGRTTDESNSMKALTSNAVSLVSTAIEQGINLFDHADIYAKGNSETIFGNVLKENPSIRDNIIIQSKCGIRVQGDPNHDSPARYDFSYDHIMSSVEGSLKRLGISYLDILLLHRPDPLMEPEVVARAFDELHFNGKVKYFGVSNFNVGQINLLQSYLDQSIIVNQVEISLLHNHLINDGILANQLDGIYAAVTGLLDYCRLNNILVQAWSPVAIGRIFYPNQNENQTSLSQEITKLAREKDTTNEAIAIAWLLKHPACIQPIIGTTQSERIINSCKGDEVEMSREEWYSLFTIARGVSVP